MMMMRTNIFYLYCYIITRKETVMKIHYKTHYILQQTRTKFVAMKHSMFNMGTFPNIELAMMACDK